MPQYNVEIWVKERDVFRNCDTFRAHDVKSLPYPVDSLDDLRTIIKLMKVEHYQIYEHAPNKWKDTGKIIETSTEVAEFLKQEEKEHNEHVDSVNAKVAAINALPKELVLGQYKDGKELYELLLQRDEAEYNGHCIDGGNIRMRHRIKGSKNEDEWNTIYPHEYRSKDGKILRVKMVKRWSTTALGNFLIPNVVIITKNYDEFKEQVEKIKRGY